MPFLRSTIVRFHQQQAAATAAVAGPVTLAYHHRVKTSALRYNAEQLSLCSKLDALYSSLLIQSKKKYPLSLLSSVDDDYHRGLFMIPDEHLEVAARYYSNNSSSIHGRRSILSSSKMLLSTITTDNISSVAYTAAHSLLARLRQQSVNQQQRKNNGIYIHGSVGVGKSMIMDLFYSICTHGLSISMDSSLSPSSSSPSFGNETNHVEHIIETDHDENTTTQYNFQPINIPTKRYHFHEFMIQIHQRIHTYKLHHPKRSDPIPTIVAQIASESRVLCFDEMQIVDIADAMIIKRILTILLELDVVIVTTSNRPPHGLYEGELIVRYLFR